MGIVVLSEAHRSLVGGTFLFQHAPSEAVELAFSTGAPVALDQAGEVIYTPERLSGVSGFCWRARYR